VKREEIIPEEGSSRASQGGVRAAATPARSESEKLAGKRREWEDRRVGPRFADVGVCGGGLREVEGRPPQRRKAPRRGLGRPR